MHKIHDRLFVGSEADCRPGSNQLAVVHACKSPCHQRAVGYSGTLARDHPHYLGFRQPFDLYLNIIDPPVPLFQSDTFARFFAFAAGQDAAARPLLIHCNQGQSRSPTLALLFLALHRKALPGASYAEARAAFAAMYPEYRPGTGLQQFVTSHWSELSGYAMSFL